jgi:hypothetical protein
MARWRRVMAGLACCGAVSGATGLAAAAGDAHKAASARIATTADSVSAGEAAATSEATVLLGQLSLPAGAVQSATEPAGDGGYLATAELGAPDTSGLADAHAWWIVPDTPEQVLAYVDEHRPAGAALFNGSPVAPEPAVPEFTLLRWPEGGGVLGERWLEVKVVRLAEGETGVRADAQVLWLRTPAPIPAGAKLLRVAFDTQTQRGTHPLERNVTSAKRIDAITALLNRLPVARPSLLTFNCPAEFGVVRLDFYATATSPPFAIAVIPVGGCGGVGLTVAGQQQPGRSSAGVDLIRRIERDLGLDVKAGPRGSASGGADNRNRVTILLTSRRRQRRLHTRIASLRFSY